LRRDASSGQSRVNAAHRIHGAGRAVRAARGDTGVVRIGGGGGCVGGTRRDARVVGARRGRRRVGPRHAGAGGRADHGASGRGARCGPAAAVTAVGSVVIHGGRWMVRVVRGGRRWWGVIRTGRVVHGRAVRSRCRRAFSVVVRRAAAILIG